MGEKPLDLRQGRAGHTIKRVVAIGSYHAVLNNLAYSRFLSRLFSHCTTPVGDGDDKQFRLRADLGNDTRLRTPRTLHGGSGRD